MKFKGQTVGRWRKRQAHEASKESQMSHDNGKPPIPFQAPATGGGVPILGQPVTVQSVYVPLIMALTCNCRPTEGREALTVHPLAGLVRLLVEKGVLTEAEAVQAFNPTATCAACHKVYNAYQPADKVQIPVGVPPAEQVPS